MIEEIHHEDEILGKAYDARLMARILRYLRPYWKLLTVAFIFLLLHTGTQLSALTSPRSPSIGTSPNTMSTA